MYQNKIQLRCMSLIDNILSQISTVPKAGGLSKPQGFDMNDDTFEKLLQKAGENQPALNGSLQSLGSLGQPSNIIIEPFGGTEPVQQTADVNKINMETFQVKDVETEKDYFSNLLKESPNEHIGIMNVAKKYAASAYNTFGKSLVENIADFAEDISKAS